MKRGKLTSRFVATVTEPGRFGDGRGGFGLSLLVKETAAGWLSKSWAQRIRVGGRETNIGLGSYPVVTLARARAKALGNARTIEAGGDPRERDGTPTFAQAADKVIALHSETWKHQSRSEGIWRASLRDYVYPKIGTKTVDQVTTADVLSILSPIWNSKRDTAKKVRQRIGAIMKWAIAQNYRPDNPAGDAIGEALPKNGYKPEPYPAIPYNQVAEVISQIRKSNAYRSTSLAFEFLVHTAARSGEVRGATWAEIDLENATWTIPSDRMKRKREHRVPLSGRALAILREASEYRDSTGLVFPSVRGKMLSDATIGKLLKDRSIPAVPHGFRTSFRTWAAERTNVAREVAEEALSHVNADRVEAAYQRSDLFERRRELMETWARYLEGASAKVVAIHQK